MLRESRSNAGGRCCRQGVHDLLRAGAKHELAAHGPMVAAERVASDPPGQLALRFCRDHADELAQILTMRTTQTIAVNHARGAAACARARGAARPARRDRSADLSLLLDRFAYRYNGVAAIPGTVAEASLGASRRSANSRRSGRVGDRPGSRARVVSYRRRTRVCATMRRPDLTTTRVVAMRARAGSVNVVVSL
jgi:hypothetical protein